MTGAGSGSGPCSLDDPSGRDGDRARRRRRSTPSACEPDGRTDQIGGGVRRRELVESGRRRLDAVDNRFGGRRAHRATRVRGVARSSATDARSIASRSAVAVCRHVVRLHLGAQARQAAAFVVDERRQSQSRASDVDGISDRPLDVDADASSRVCERGESHVPGDAIREIEERDGHAFTFARHECGEETGTESVVDVHAHDLRRARVEHPEQRGESTERRPVPDRRRHRDDRQPGESADDRRQRALHPATTTRASQLGDALEPGERDGGGRRRRRRRCGRRLRRRTPR